MGDAAVDTCGHRTGKDSLYEPFSCRVDAVKGVTPSEKLFRLVREDGKPFGHKPGQFMQVSILGAGEAPISVASSPTRGDYLELGVRRAGSLTGLMHGLKKGDTVGLRGPFGTHFDTDAMQGKDLVLVAGGCGMAPMRALIQHCEDRREDFGRVTVLLGAKSPEDVLFKDEVMAWQQGDALDTHVTVDEAPDSACWEGKVGLLPTLIPPLEIDPAKTVAAIVGPPVMYRFVLVELRRKGVPDDRIVVSLERHMKCGVGKCGHCTIDHLYCCLDGPVFWLNQVESIRGAL
jgi:NAD(P)H-flavin reductase